MSEKQSPTLDLNEVEAQEVKEHAYASGIKVAGATDPYAGTAPYASGATTASAETGTDLPAGNRPDSTAAGGASAEQQQEADVVAGAGSLGGEEHGLGKVKEGLKEALGLKRD